MSFLCHRCSLIHHDEASVPAIPAGSKSTRASRVCTGTDEKDEKEVKSIKCGMQHQTPDGGLLLESSDIPTNTFNGEVQFIILRHFQSSICIKSV